MTFLSFWSKAYVLWYPIDRALSQRMHRLWIWAWLLFWWLAGHMHFLCILASKFQVLLFLIVWKVGPCRTGFLNGWVAAPLLNNPEDQHLSTQKNIRLGLVSVFPVMNPVFMHSMCYWIITGKCYVACIGSSGPGYLVSSCLVGFPSWSEIIIGDVYGACRNAVYS